MTEEQYQRGLKEIQDRYKARMAEIEARDQRDQTLSHRVNIAALAALVVLATLQAGVWLWGFVS